MGEKGPLVKRIDKYERKQHNNLPYTISYQGILQKGFTDKVTNKYSFSCHMLFHFIAFLHSSKDNTN